MLARFVRQRGNGALVTVPTPVKYHFGHTRGDGLLGDQFAECGCLRNLSRFGTAARVSAYDRVRRVVVNELHVEKLVTAKNRQSGPGRSAMHSGANARVALLSY